MENRAPYSIRGGYGANAPAGRGGGDGAGYSVVFPGNYGMRALAKRPRSHYVRAET
jgi:hypothetical protein